MKKIITLLLAGLAATATMARQITPAEALARTLQNDSPLRAKATGPETWTLAHTESTGEDNCYYVLNHRSGSSFMVVADDRLPALLAYSDRGAFDAAEMPPAVRWWFDETKRQTAYAIANDLTLAEPAPLAESVEPLLTTQWDQGYPYYKQCPQKKTQWSNDRCQTGCVATAMAQIMKYHQWPHQGQGTISYQNQQFSLNVTANLAETTYDWAAMQDTYNGYNNPSEAEQAVATLMFHCGASVRMNYGTEWSEANDDAPPAAFINHFNYDLQTRYVNRQYYTADEWDQMMRTELSDHRPMLYGGATAKGEGHQFVIDGYDSLGRYHVNWGWSGRWDGYYTLDNLKPSGQGTGGAAVSAPFSYYQCAIIGIQPPQQGSTLAYMMYIDKMPDLETTTSQGAQIDIVIPRMPNKTSLPFRCQIGMALSDSEGNVVSTMFSYDGMMLAEETGLTYKDFEAGFQLPAHLTDGCYTLQPIFRVEGEEELRTFLIAPGYPKQYYLKVSDNVVQVSCSPFPADIIEEPTSIRSTATADSQPRYYDLQGRKAKENVRGLIVVQKQGRRIITLRK